MVTFKKLESLGGVGSIMTGFACVAIGWMDYTTGQSWHIWAIMCVVLMLNGVLMLVHASRRPEVPAELMRREEILGVQNQI